MDSSLITGGVVTTAIVLPTVATACVVLRLKIRMGPNQGVGADDWMALISLVLSWAISIDTFVAAGRGGINTISTDPISAARAFLLCMWISAFPFAICLATVKIAVLLFYRRVFVTKWFRFAVWIMIAVLTSWAIGVVISQLLDGDPIQGAWDPVHPSYRFPYYPLGISVASLSLAFDVIVLFFPVRPIAKLQMPLKRKCAIIGIFWLGGFCCIAGAVRVYWVHESVNSVAINENVNRYETATNFYLWELIEPNASIIAACLPTFAPMLGSPFMKAFSSRLRSFFTLPSKGKSDEEKYNHSDESASTANLTDGSRDGASSADHKNLVTSTKTEHDVELGRVPSARE